MANTDKRDPDKLQQDERKRQEQEIQEQKQRNGGQGAKPGQTDQARNRDTGHTGNR